MSTKSFKFPSCSNFLFVKSKGLMSLKIWRSSRHWIVTTQPPLERWKLICENKWREDIVILWLGLHSGFYFLCFNSYVIYLLFKNYHHGVIFKWVSIILLWFEMSLKLYIHYCLLWHSSSVPFDIFTSNSFPHFFKHIFLI